MKLVRETTASLFARSARSAVHGTLVGLLALGISACEPRPPAIVESPVDELPPPNPRVAATDEDRRACARLAMLGCSDAPKCLLTIADARTDHVSVPSVCLAAAADLAAVRRCGDVGTLTFNCLHADAATKETP